ncbi:MAG: hypothetical protein IJO91_03260 [Oscillospiraceae bacterium]|nr:hypothetical protein [Oscillospiraceae bacterium]
MVIRSLSGMQPIGRAAWLHPHQPDFGRLRHEYETHIKRRKSFFDFQLSQPYVQSPALWVKAQGSDGQKMQQNNG